MSAHTSGRSTRCPTHSVPYLIRESGSINGGVVIWGCIICVTEQRDALTEANARLLAAAECAEAYELQDDWREILAKHGWNENEQVASVFIRKLRREALASVMP